jgi:NDP-sugar pyrophosphorylase family protein
VGRLVVNTHWRSEAYPRIFPEPAYRGVPIHFRDEQPEVLETAGGIWNVRDLLGQETFFVYNGDILSDLPLGRALKAHREMRNEVTMVLRSSGGPLQVAFDAKSERVTDIGGRVDAAAGPRFLFTGIYLVNAEFVARIPAATKISVVPIFCEMIRSGARLGGVIIDEGRWWDLGNRENYLDVHAALATPQSAPWIHPTAQVAPSAIIRGATAIGAGVHVGENARVSDSLIWDGAEIASSTVLDRCIVTDGQRVEGSHSHADI